MNKNIEKCINRYKSLIGTKFNSLTIIDIHPDVKGGQYKLICKCDCGNTTITRASRVINGYTKTCGCRNEGVNKYNSNRISRKYSNLYSCWNTMRHRCYNPQNERYKYYGARGITVCDEWKKSFEPFLNWALSNGYEKGLTIDRVDVNGNYEPNNCRWVSNLCQARNKRNNRMVEFQGETKCVSQWCEDLNLPYHTIRARLRLGWDAEKAFNTPVRNKSCN